MSLLGLSLAGGIILEGVNILKSGVYLEEVGHWKSFLRVFMLFLSPSFPSLFPGVHKPSIFVHLPSVFPHHRSTGWNNQQ